MNRIQTIDAPQMIFPSEEYIGEGKQARLDLAIDETAVKGKWRPPTPRPQQMREQTEIGDQA